MQTDDEITLKNLLVIGAIAHNDKLCTNNDSYDLYTPTSFRGLMRFWYGERRQQNIARVRQTVRSALLFVKKTYEEASLLMKNEHALPLMVDGLVIQHVRMRDALKKCTFGLQNLLQTYREDATLSSQITLTIQEVNDFLKMMDCNTTQLRNSMSSAQSRLSLISTPTPSNLDERDDFAE